MFYWLNTAAVNCYHFVQELYFTRHLFVHFVYVPCSRDDVHIVSTETVRNIQGNAQIHTAHGITPD